MIEELKQTIDNATKKKWNFLKSRSFKMTCNSLIKLLNQANNHYNEKKYEMAYVEYMCVLNIFIDYLNKLKDYDSKISEYKILSNELDSSENIIIELKTILQQKKVSNTNLPQNNYVNQSSSPQLRSKKTISSDKLYSYIKRLTSGNERKPPQILVIDIRRREDYETSHINWSSNPNFKYNGCINIPLDFFYGIDVDINAVLTKATQNESNYYKKELINNLLQADLIVYYDSNSKTIKDQVHQIIVNILYNNGKNLERPPIMLEEGYSGWIDFIKKTGGNIYEWTESNSTNNFAHYNSGKVNNINKNEVNNYSNEALTSSFYTQFAQNSELMNMTQPSNNAYTQQPMTIPSATESYNMTMPTTDYYSKINITPSAPSVDSFTSYPTIDNSVLPQNVKPEIPDKPFNLKYQSSSSNQNITATPSNFTYSSHQPTIPNYSYPQQQPTVPHYYPQTIPQNSIYSSSQQPISNPTSNSMTDLYPNKIPPEIPKKENSQSKLPSATSIESLNTNLSKPLPPGKSNGNSGQPPAIPSKPTREYSLNEIHNTKNGSVGLKNLGNTCYMNSILQCLNATSPLTHFFLSGNFRNDINEQNDLGTHGKLANEYYSFLNAIWYEHQPIVSPANIKSAISNFNEEFIGSDQHDSQEFLSCILDGLHEDLNVARRKKSNSYIESKRKEHNNQEKEEEREEFDVETLRDRAWKRYIDFNYSIIVTTFQGQYMSVLKCSQCGKISPTFNSLMYLSLPIPDNARNLKDCLDKYIEIEYLKGNDGWKCPRCNKKVDAQKQLILSKLPDIMLIQLKRFYFQGPFRDKINKYIDFPIKNLDLSPYTYKFKQKESCYTYNLFAISNHYGTLSGGHYTAFIKNKSNDGWIEFNDSRYSDISESKIKVCISIYVNYY
jgi:ubiquitin carboxyl-terminal hydrolase 8